MHDKLSTLSGAFRTMLSCVDPNPDREGIAETPMRMAKAWCHHTMGYNMDPVAVLKSFKDGAEFHSGNEPVVVGGIRFYSRCEHHGEAIFGVATVGYIPNGTVVGLSKLSRLVEVFARRLQVQERLTGQIANTLHDALDCKGAGVVIRARHLCMESRGVQQYGTVTTTTAFTGWMDNHRASLLLVDANAAI